jgi:hypothetical protein
MTETPKLLPGREIKRRIAAVREQQNDLLKAIQAVDEKIRSLPPGEAKRRLRADQDELKRQSGLCPEPPRAPREDWPAEKWVGKSIELKEAARKWKLAGRLYKAKKFLTEARIAENKAAYRQR